MTEFAVVIPARYASERLPGKPLRVIAGKPMLQHVHEKAKASGAVEVVVATDDERILRAAESFQADCCMTSTDHRSGTDRLAEVAGSRQWPDERIIVNLQGDEPLMPSNLIGQCAGLLADESADIATLASPLLSSADFENPNVVKVVTDDRGFALYFSRAGIPFPRSAERSELAWQTALHHHGIYAYRCSVLKALVATPQSHLEICEQLEQLRALSLGMQIKVGVPATRPGAGVDTEDDLREVERTIAQHGSGAMPGDS